MTDSLAREIAKASSLARTLITAYTDWRDDIRYGDEMHSIYMDALDFVNFRIETADSCLLLIGNRRIADALGLCRSLLENHLLFMLMCRGTRFFQLEDTRLKGAAFKTRHAERQAELAQLQAEGKTACIAVEAYPRRPSHLMHIFEGLNTPDPDVPEFRIPVHYFHFRDFHPETMRLADEDYFRYYELPPEAKKADKKHRLDQERRYRFYLSYEGLLTCLELNSLADYALRARIEAHYTFLGKFLHPTHNAARDLHDHANVYYGGTGIGMDQQYTQMAVLLACLYVCYLLAAILNEAASLFEVAPAKYMADPGTTALRAATARVPAEFSYFWFLFNDPPLWDRYNYCIHYATDDELAAWGGYENVPFDRVPFGQYIYDHLKHALGNWGNTRCGAYRPPLA
jgi:hypothetical protein